jgi:hypothetical protein
MGAGMDREKANMLRDPQQSADTFPEEVALW